MLLLQLLATAGTTAVAAGGNPTLVDHAIASGLPPLYLDGDGWTATNVGGPQQAQPPLPATVPGDILTDLQRAGRTGDPYWNTTWRDPDYIAAWNNGTWTYRRTFATPTAAGGTPAAGSQLLVLDGIRMGAVIILNGAPLGNATNQFQRYVFPLPAGSLKGSAQQNVLEITFGAELGIDCGGRWTYSSSIDWAPVMTTHDNASKRSTFGFGIWKSVYLLSVPIGSAAIAEVAPQTFYQGVHPTTRLLDDSHEGFEVQATVDLIAPAAGTKGTVTVVGGWAGAVARCWYYEYAPTQLVKSGANWVQKMSDPKPNPAPPPPSPAPPAGPPSPPPCRPPPAELQCTAWNRTADWTKVGCDTNGTNCVLVIEVRNQTGSQASLNVLPFVAPKAMRLPQADLTVSVSETTGSERVAITITANATALFVVLTTSAPGRFSDNAVLLEGGEATVIEFVSWDGPLNATGLSLLKSSLRVEHLADNMRAKTDDRAAASATSPEKKKQPCVIKPGSLPLDTAGRTVHAHGAGVYSEGDSLYLLGTSEKRAVPADSRDPQSPIVYLSESINLYKTERSINGLCNWQFVGAVVNRSTVQDAMRPALPINVTARVERPKLIKTTSRRSFRIDGRDRHAKDSLAIQGIQGIFQKRTTGDETARWWGYEPLPVHQVEADRPHPRHPGRPPGLPAASPLAAQTSPLYINAVHVSICIYMDLPGTKFSTISASASNSVACDVTPAATCAKP